MTVKHSFTVHQEASMRNRFGTTACLAVVLASGAVATADDKVARPAPAATPSASETRDEIQKTVGFVPQFIKAMPDSLVGTFWSGIKSFQMNPNTALDSKTKELIGLGVASQIPCDFCVYFHTAAARRAGASETEIKEAVGEAAFTRLASTMLSGLQTDMVQFKKDVDRMMPREPKGKAQARTP
jgi:AhpD family alkylhydroperoxidase